MKTFVLTVSKVFPATHKRKGEPTFFVEKIFNGLNQTIPCNLCEHERFCSKHCVIDSMNLDPKIHTIRKSYPLWKSRIEQVQKGEAILSIRYWSEKPYRSKQIEICQLVKDSGIGVQEIIMYPDETSFLFGIGFEPHNVFWSDLAKNDGLSLEDFKDWFRKYDLSKPMAILHFTNFRY